MKKDRTSLDRPTPHSDTRLWGSDVLAETIRAMGFKHIALNPGSSFRGLHDSLVNHLGNRDPQMLLCLHEEHAVAIAHGWAKVTGEPMAVFLHANVGLMHASMAIYNAWCDRVPMVIFGATGPVDADKRRPWIDWIHTSRDQGALVRPYTKFDDQPSSLAASVAAIARARTIASTAPHGPTYVCFDVSVQEAPADPLPLPDPALHRPPAPPSASDAQIDDLVALLKAARKPVFLMGRVSRSEDDWARRVALAEAVEAQVITDIKTGASFPTDHRLHVGAPSFFLPESSAKTLAEADLIVAFDWVDPAGTIRQAGARGDLVNVTLDHHLANGWSLDHMGQAPARLNIAALPDTVIGAVCKRFGIFDCAFPVFEQVPPSRVAAESPLSMDAFSSALAVGLEGEPVTFVRLPLGWNGGARAFLHPMDYLGYDGGAGIGSGPGMLVGAALALEDSDRIPVAVLGDGDTMMGISALWTAARYGIPFILIVCNNRSYFNDEVHQEKVAVIRGRPVANKGVGQAISEPDINFAEMARAQGLSGLGPVRTAGDLTETLREAVQIYKSGGSVLIDARVEPEYAKAMAEGMTEN